MSFRLSLLKGCRDAVGFCRILVNHIGKEVESWLLELESYAIIFILSLVRWGQCVPIILGGRCVMIRFTSIAQDCPIQRVVTEGLFLENWPVKVSTGLSPCYAWDTSSSSDSLSPVRWLSQWTIMTIIWVQWGQPELKLKLSHFSHNYCFSRNYSGRLFPTWSIDHRWSDEGKLVKFEPEKCQFDSVLWKDIIYIMSGYSISPVHLPFPAVLCSGHFLALPRATRKLRFKKHQQLLRGSKKG